MTIAAPREAPAGPGRLVRLDRQGVQRWLPLLDDWLLPGHLYGVQHTWPQLYRSDGDGAFFALLDGDRLVSHCAVRTAEVLGPGGRHRVGLLGSVATDPARRGRGAAGAVLAAALDHLADRVAAVFLWAERPDLYARHGFRPGPAEQVLLLARRPRPSLDGVRLATIADHPALHALHAAKPWRVERSPQALSGLLTTPGLTTVVRERDGAIAAYACCGKGADLQGHWHELGGSDAELAELLPAALHLTDQIEAAVLVPPYRPDLARQLGRCVVGSEAIPGPMAWTAGGPPPACWFDGLDSV